MAVIQETAKRAEDVSSEKHEPEVLQEEAELQKETASPTRLQLKRVMSPEDTLKKTNKSSERSSVEHSPLHPHYQAKLGVKVNGTSSPCPSWERKVSSETARASAPLTPGRSRMRSTVQGTETPDEGLSVPKFGEWDESDPASADGYTQIFNIVKEERQGGAGTTPSLQADKRYMKELNQFGNRGSKIMSSLVIKFKLAKLIGFSAIVEYSLYGIFG
ncbi:hypothetical protein V2J09_017821 [Rumex salicifolius]